MPRAPKSPKQVTPLTTAESLRRILKSARDIMRKDKGLNGDLDRLPMLTWIMFLKFLDDLERLREDEAVLAGVRYLPAIEAPYRWRDWASRKDGVTGPELLAFINQDEATRPDGKKGSGLFAYLRKLEARQGVERRGVIAKVFEGAQNRMESGYLLRDILNLVDGIHFTSREEIHTLSALYETMLREMRDAAGDSGEFYTPRPVVRFMVEALAPQLGETILDPAAGTGGFLVESLVWLMKLKEANTVEGREQVQRSTLIGGEAKPLPYLLCQMNLLLHGLESPNIRKGNSLDVNLNEITEKDRVDIILTNPPFGGEEEKGILTNFPKDKQTAETALLFLQLIMRKLKKQKPHARAGVVVPNGTLFADGIAARIKEELLSEFNLHTIVRLPNGVFSPYTDIPANLLFFDRRGPTKTVWFYELPLPEGRKKYSKTMPLRFEEFADAQEWWSNRSETDQAWQVPASELLANNCNLDRKNPRARLNAAHLPPPELAASIEAKQRRILEIIGNIKALLEVKP